MPKTSPRSDWHALSRALHWLIAALILAMAWLGLTLGDLPNGPDKIATYALHKSIGLSILALAALRLLWRLQAGARAQQRALARAVRAEQADDLAGTHRERHARERDPVAVAAV